MPCRHEVAGQQHGLDSALHESMAAAVDAVDSSCSLSSTLDSKIANAMQMQMQMHSLQPMLPAVHTPVPPPPSLSLQHPPRHNHAIHECHCLQRRNCRYQLINNLGISSISRHTARIAPAASQRNPTAAPSHPPSTKSHHQTR